MTSDDAERGAGQSENKAAEKEEEENRKVRKQVERLKLTEDTAVQQSLEALDRVKELVAALSKEGAEKRTRPAQPPLAADLQQHRLCAPSPR